MSAALVRIRPEHVERMVRRESATLWRRDLFDAGLPQALDELDLTDADEPARAFVAALEELYEGVARLEALEARHVELARPHPWAVGQVSNWVWVPPVFVLAASVQFFGLWGIVVSVLLFGAVAVVGLLVLAETERRRRAALREVRRITLRERAALATLGEGTLRGPLDVSVAGVRYVIAVADPD